MCVLCKFVVKFKTKFTILLNLNGLSVVVSHYISYLLTNQFSVNYVENLGSKWTFSVSHHNWGKCRFCGDDVRVSVADNFEWKIDETNRWRKSKLRLLYLASWIVMIANANKYFREIKSHWIYVCRQFQCISLSHKYHIKNTLSSRF